MKLLRRYPIKTSPVYRLIALILLFPLLAVAERRTPVAKILLLNGFPEAAREVSLHTKNSITILENKTLPVHQRKKDLLVRADELENYLRTIKKDLSKHGLPEDIFVEMEQDLSDAKLWISRFEFSKALTLLRSYDAALDQYVFVLRF